MYTNKENYAKCPTILIFDSGIGGLEIYKVIKKVLPNIRYLYVFDNKGFPYGEKSEKFIIKRSLSIIKTIIQMYHLDLIIVACNTISVISLSILKRHISCPIIGITPAIKLATQLTKNCIIGLLATEATIKCNFIHNLLNRVDRKYQILKLGITKLAEIAEKKIYGKKASLTKIEKLIHPILSEKNIPDTIILGCTHFQSIQKEIKKVLPKDIVLIDSRFIVLKKTIYALRNKKSFFRKEENINKIYCVNLTSKMKSILPKLGKLGFTSLNQLDL